MEKQYTSYDDVVGVIHSIRTYICGQVHDDSHDFEPMTDLPFVCGTCGWIHPGSGILGDIQYLTMALMCARFEGTRRYMEENQLTAISARQMMDLIEKGVCVESDMAEVDSLIASIQHRLEPFHDMNKHRFEMSEVNPGCCKHCGWIDDKTMSPLPQMTLREYVSKSIDTALETRHALIYGREASLIVMISSKPRHPSDVAHLN